MEAEAVRQVATEVLKEVVAGRLSSALVVLARVLRKVRALAEEPATPLGVGAARQDREHRGGLGAVEQVALVDDRVELAAAGKIVDALHLLEPRLQLVGVVVAPARLHLRLRVSRGEDTE